VSTGFFDFFPELNLNPSLKGFIDSKNLARAGKK
jgi:hypothetical protein